MPPQAPEAAKPVPEIAPQPPQPLNDADITKTIVQNITYNIHDTISGDVVASPGNVSKPWPSMVRYRMVGLWINGMLTVKCGCRRINKTEIYCKFVES